ncbi:MAG: HipA domain-containing protein [Bacilli bacterium]|nr:HipA domain-containing protein [Bacilli bacterium]
MNKICLCCQKEITSANMVFWHDSCSKKLFGVPSNKLTALIFEEVENLINQNVEKGVSVSGVQKKLSMSIESQIDRKRKTLALHSLSFIVKTNDMQYPHLPEYENALMNLAELSGLPVVPHSLFPINKGGYVYISKRIDRDFSNGKKIKYPMEDFCQLEEKLTEYKYSGSYEKCTKDVIRKYSSNPFIDTVLFFKGVVFSYLTGNTDMHLKNFSLIDKGKGHSLAPFYDLVPAEIIVPQKEMALTVNGKNQKIRKKDFINFALNIGINEATATKIINALLSDLPTWLKSIDSSFLDEGEKEEYKAFLKERNHI